MRKELRQRKDKKADAGALASAGVPSEETAKAAAAATAPAPAAAAAAPPHSEGDALDEGDDGEWDMNNGKHCLEMLEHKFTQQDLHKSGLSITQFGKVCEFYIDFLKRKTPKASLAFHFTADIDHGIFSTSKQRLEWLKSFAAQRALQYVQKPKPTTK